MKQSARISAVVLAAVTIVATSACSNSKSDSSRAADDAGRKVDAGRIWQMHAIDSRYRGANALDAADVNGDGRDDYVTNYEFDQRYIVTFTPPNPDDLVKPWPNMTFYCPTAVPGRGCDTESATLADVDGDGAYDIVGAQGGHPDLVFDGDEPGVRVIWGPAKEQATDPAAWQDAGRFPQTVERGHFLDLGAIDLNGDGATDIAFGGRVYFRNGAKGGIAWLEAPIDRAQRRDLAAWKLHYIDPDTPGGHGFVFTDLNGDGALDVVDANADFDTPNDQSAVYWYENPGTQSPAITNPWKKTELYRDPNFYGKPQVVVADLNGDGRNDLVTQTQDNYLFFMRKPGAAVAFDLVKIAKPDVIKGPTRALAVADMNNDGRSDVVAMMTHDDGKLPVGKASVYWLSFNGPQPGPDFTVHVIKWSSGRLMGAGFLGEKWDQMRIRDVNNDGAPDIVANDEEWFHQPGGELVPFDRRSEDGESVAVVWFENPLRQASSGCREQGSGCELEAEAFTNMADGQWIERNEVPGASGSRYLQAFNAFPPSGCPARPRAGETVADCPKRPDGALLPEDFPGVSYAAQVNGGSYDVWARIYAPPVFGSSLGAAKSDSAWVSLDANPAALVGDEGVPPGAWTWVKTARATSLAKGTHTLTLRVRERGVAVDRIALVAAGAPPPA